MMPIESAIRIRLSHGFTQSVYTGPVGGRRTSELRGQELGRFFTLVGR